MLIKIIKGTYGHRPELPNGKKSPFIVRVTPDSLPIDVDESEAKRLIKEGTAEKIGAEKEAEKVPDLKPTKKSKEHKAEEVTE